MGREGTKTDVLHLPGRAKDGAMLLQKFGTRVLEHFTVVIFEIGAVKTVFVFLKRVPALSPTMCKV